jgi:hypothetical protein
MKFGQLTAASLLTAAVLSAPVIAKDEPSYVVVNEEMGVPVFPYDITDRPYLVVAPIKAGVRKATIFSKEPSQQKIYNEVWERAEKLDADAVVNVTYGDSHMTVMSWGKTNALGTAIRFLTEDEIASGMKGETAPDPSTYTKEMFKNANKLAK